MKNERKIICRDYFSQVRAGQGVSKSEKIGMCKSPSGIEPTSEISKVFSMKGVKNCTEAVTPTEKKTNKNAESLISETS